MYSLILMSFRTRTGFSGSLVIELFEVKGRILRCGVYFKFKGTLPVHISSPYQGERNKTSYTQPSSLVFTYPLLLSIVSPSLLSVVWSVKLMTLDTLTFSCFLLCLLSPYIDDALRRWKYFQPLVSPLQSY